MLSFLGDTGRLDSVSSVLTTDGVVIFGDRSAYRGLISDIPDSGSSLSVLGITDDHVMDGTENVILADATTSAIEVTLPAASL